MGQAEKRAHLQAIRQRYRKSTRKQKYQKVLGSGQRRLTTPTAHRTGRTGPVSGSSY